MLDGALDTLIDCAAVPALLADPDRRIVRLNAQASGLLEAAVHAAVGSPLDPLLKSQSVSVASDRPLFDCHGAVAGHLVVLRAADVFLGRDTAVRGTEATAIERLAAGIAHDFDNVLAIVSGHLQMAEMCRPDQAVTNHIRQSLLACAMATRMTRRLKSFAASSAVKSVPTDINGLIEPIVATLATPLEGRITLMHALAADLPPCLVDAAGFEAALLNLLVNAVEATPDGGTIVVSTHRDTTREPHAVWIKVADTGSGMPDYVAARAFEPYFTTKPPHQGTGLGLASVEGFARQSGGTVTLDTRLGAGTEIVLKLPVGG